MTPSVFDRANAVGKYAAKLIFDLQREYTAESEWCEQVSLPDLEQSLKETLNAAYSA